MYARLVSHFFTWDGKFEFFCTVLVGPACQKIEILEKMLEAGMNVARLNFSHGTHEYHSELIKNIRTAVDNYSKKIGRYCPLAIAIDTKGSEIRTGVLEGVKITVLFLFFLEYSVLGNFR